MTKRQEEKYNRIKAFLEYLRENSGKVERKIALSWACVYLGVAKVTAYQYLKDFENLKFIKIDDDDIITVMK
ncbi:MAG: hypothetical protein ACE5ES_01790 [Candidatus Nanoarchaeia archaeon]